MKDGYINACGAPEDVLTKSSFIERQQSQTSQTGEHGSGDQVRNWQKVQYTVLEIQFQSVTYSLVARICKYFEQNKPCW